MLIKPTSNGCSVLFDNKLNFSLLIMSINFINSKTLRFSNPIRELNAFYHITLVIQTFAVITIIHNTFKRIIIPNGNMINIKSVIYFKNVLKKAKTYCLYVIRR